jgi:TPR repeat protein
MRRRSFILGLAVSATVTVPAVRAESASEPLLRHELLEAAWPADISRLARTYIERYPHGPLIAQAHAALHEAGRTLRTLERRDVRLYRSDFQVDGLPDGTRERVRQAALGDGEAAFQVAQWHQRGEAGVPRDTNRYVGWMQYAAALGHAVANYELALYYRREDQPALAAPYEARAEELGYQAPPALDNIRK